MREKYEDLPSFDELKSLAKENPEALEELRVSLVRQIINSVGDPERKRRLEGLNFVIEMNKKKAKNPLQSCLILSRMMWDSAIIMAEITKNSDNP